MKIFYILLVGCLFVPSLILCLDDTAKSDKSASVALTKKLGEENNIVLSLVKSVVDFASNGFKTGLEASMRSIFNKPVTTAVYALSMLVGVVAMLAFYESPISPMPVPALPDPPVGRFPPEHAVWPPKNQGGPNMPYNQKRAGLAMPQHHQVMNMMNPNYYQYQTVPDNHRSDKNIGQPMVRNKLPAVAIAPNHMNETSYNNYISKLTSALDLNNNPNAGQVLEQLKHMTNSELSNKVIDYNNKRMAVESLKYNSTQTVA